MQADLGTFCLFFFVLGLFLGLFIGWVEIGAKNRKLAKQQILLQKLKNRRI